MKIGAMPAIILMFIGIATWIVLVIMLYVGDKAKYRVRDIQFMAQPIPINISIWFNPKKGDIK